MLHSIMLSLGAAGAIGLGTLAFQGDTSQTREDCPGQITCPQTGETICADQCPLDEAVPACCRE